MEELFKRLFILWELDTWANILEVLGFAIAIWTFFISQIVKSEVNKLKTNYIFDKRADKHLLNLKESASEINRLLNEYDNNRDRIRTELSKCISELEDIIPKINYNQSSKCRNLMKFIKSRRSKTFVERKINTSSLQFYLVKNFRRIFETTYDDVWIVYNGLIEIIRLLENIKQNKKLAL